MPTKLWPNRRASSWASMTTLMAFSVNLSNIIRVGCTLAELRPAARMLRLTLLWKLSPAVLRLMPSNQPEGCRPALWPLQDAVLWLCWRQAASLGATTPTTGLCPQVGSITAMFGATICARWPEHQQGSTSSRGWQQLREASHSGCNIRFALHKLTIGPKKALPISTSACSCSSTPHGLHGRGRPRVHTAAASTASQLSDQHCCVTDRQQQGGDAA